MRWLHSPSSFLRRRQPRPRAGLTVERLETRAVPDAALSAAFVGQAFRDLLHREADPAALAFFTSRLEQGVNRTEVVRAIQASPEYQAGLAQDVYQGLLHRAAEPEAVSGVQAFLSAGGTPEMLQTHLAGSPEYFTSRGGGTTAGFLDVLYQDAFGRPIDPSGAATFNALLVGGAARWQVAAAVFNSPEYRTVEVNQYYQTFLGRPADAAGLAIFTHVLERGRSADVVALLVASQEYAPGGNPPAPPPVPGGGTAVLTAAEVAVLLQRAAAASASEDAIIAVVDRGGRVLGVRVEGGVSPALIGTPSGLTFAVDGALAEARTAAFFANNQAPLTSRTVSFISQSTVTQREVDSNPSITDPFSVFRGPGFVAPVRTGGHFPPGVPFTPPVDLFGIEHTNRDSILHVGPDRIKGTGDDVPLPARFNINPAFIPAGVQLTPPESYGFVSGILPGAQARGIGTLPGGIPLYKNGTLVGGIGVFFPGVSGVASEENSALDARFNPLRPDRSLEAEFIAFAAAGGSSGAAATFGAINGVPPLPGFDLPFGRIDLVGVTLDIFGPGGTQGVATLVQTGRAYGVGNPNTGTNLPVGLGGDRFPTPAEAANTLLDGRLVAEGWLVLPHDGVGLSAAQVQQMIVQGINQAAATRAAIRLPLGSRTRMVFAVADTTGEVLGLFRMPDATVFSIDVAVAKARNVAYYANPAQLQAIDMVPGVPAGAALTNRTFRFLSQPRFPEGIDGTAPAPFSQLLTGGASLTNAVSIGPPLPASAFQTPFGFDAFNPATNFHQPFSLNQNGVVFFPGSTPVYTPGLVGGLGVSGDGVDQDDVVTFAGAQGFAAPGSLRADQFFFNGVRLPFQKFPRNPEG